MDTGETIFFFLYSKLGKTILTFAQVLSSTRN